MGCAAMLIQLDGFEWLYEFSRAHEDWELDELIMMVPAIAIVGCILVVFKHRAQAKTMARLKEANTELVHLRKQQDGFMHAITHELRTPMHQVRSLLELLREPSLLPQERDSYVEKAGESAKRLHGHMERILEFASIGSPTFACNRNFFSPEALGRALTTRYAAMAKQANTTLQCEFQPEMPAIVTGCERIASRCIELLLENALTFAHGTTVTLRVSLEAQGEQHQMLALEVRDTGPGIPAAVEQQLFDPFMHVEEDASHSHGGVGMGLAIVNRMALAVGGKVQVQNQPGRGVLFRVLLPVSEAS